MPHARQFTRERASKFRNTLSPFRVTRNSLVSFGMEPFKELAGFMKRKVSEKYFRKLALEYN